MEAVRSGSTMRTTSTFGGKAAIGRWSMPAPMQRRPRSSAWPARGPRAASRRRDRARSPPRRPGPSPPVAGPAPRQGTRPWPDGAAHRVGLVGDEGRAHGGSFSSSVGRGRLGRRHRLRARPPACRLAAIRPVGKTASCKPKAAKTCVSSISIGHHSSAMRPAGGGPKRLATAGSCVSDAGRRQILPRRDSGRQRSPLVSGANRGVAAGTCCRMPERTIGTARKNPGRPSTILRRGAYPVLLRSAFRREIRWPASSPSSSPSTATARSSIS